MNLETTVTGDWNFEVEAVNGFDLEVEEEDPWSFQVTTSDIRHWLLKDGFWDNDGEWVNDAIWRV